MICLQKVLNISLQGVLKTSWRRLEDVLKTLEDVFKTSWRCLEEVLKMYWRRLEDVLKTSWRCLENLWPRRIYWSWPKRLEDVLITSWRRMAKTNILVLTRTSWRRLEDVLKTSWRHLEDVLKTYGQDKYIGPDQDVLKTSSEDERLRPTYSSWSRRLKEVFWRRRRKASSRRLHQDECLLGLAGNLFYSRTVSSNKK